MPFPHPKSLSNSETYAITAYLLYENGVTYEGEELDEDFVMDREKFVKIAMPNKDGFYPNVDTPENPQQGVENMRSYLADMDNYGNGTRCMTNCFDGKVPVMRITNELNDFHPAASTERSLPAKKEGEKAHPGKEGYENYCSACHGNDALGAPVPGDKKAWAKVIDKGMYQVYDHAINGYNAMPPKGGNMDLEDDEVKVIVDYMISISK
jgi:cytochrome c